MHRPRSQNHSYIHAYTVAHSHRNMSHVYAHTLQSHISTNLNSYILINILSQTPGYRIPVMLRHCHTQSPPDPMSQRSQPSPPRPPYFVASAQTPAGFVLKSLPAYFAQSNNFPKKPSNRQLDGGGEGAGMPENPGRLLIKIPVGAEGGGLFQTLK